MTMRTTDIAKLQRAIKHIDKAYDLIQAVLNNLNSEHNAKEVEVLEDAQREISNQCYYIQDLFEDRK